MKRALLTVLISGSLLAVDECSDRKIHLQKMIRTFTRMAERAEDEADRVSGKDGAEARHARRKAAALREKACQLEEELRSK